MESMIPDPIELLEARIERMIEKYMPANKPGMFLCASCEQWHHESGGIVSADSDPASPPICMACWEILKACNGDVQWTESV